MSEKIFRSAKSPTADILLGL